MWIPIEAVKYVDDDTRRLSKDVSRYFRYEAHRENMEPKIGRTARAPLTDTYKHKIGVSKTWREDQIKCDSGVARSARKCAVHTCNPRAQWTSRVGPYILHIEKIPYMWIFLSTQALGAQLQIQCRRRLSCRRNQRPTRKARLPLLGHGPAGKATATFRRGLPTTSPRWFITHTGRKAYSEYRARSRCVILSSTQQRDRPRKYDAIICLGEKMKMKEHWETEMLFGAKNTTNEDSHGKTERRQCRSNTRNAFPQTRTCSTRQRKQRQFNSKMSQLILATTDEAKDEFKPKGPNKTHSK